LAKPFRPSRYFNPFRHETPLQYPAKGLFLNDFRVDNNPRNRIQYAGFRFRRAASRTVFTELAGF
jgi:hypothetical protein